MKKLADLQSRQAAITERQKVILADATTATAGELTEPQRVEFDALDTEYAANEASIAVLAKDAERATKLASRVPTKVILPTQTARTETVGASQDKGRGVRVISEGWQEDPKCGFADSREFLTLVMEAGKQGSTTDPRLKYMVAGSDEQSTISDPHGGFFIPEGFSPDVLKVMSAADPLKQYVKSVPMTFPVLNFNARVDKNHSTSVSGGFIVYRRVETQPVADSRATYEQVVLNVNSLMGLAYATEELIERSPISFIAVIEDGMRDEFPAKMMKERLNGTGVGQFEGILNSPALLTVNRETGQGTSTVLFENIINMSARCWGYDNAVWIINHTDRVQLRTLVQVIGISGVNVPLFTNEGGVERLDGRPVIFTEFAPVGRPILANLSQYLEGTLRGMRSAESMHVRFANHERTFKFWMENDARGWWSSVLTPYLGNTMSPFVVLSASAG